MKRFYTCACNFYYGKTSQLLINKKKTLPLNGRRDISFSKIKIFSRNSKEKIVGINEINSLPKNLKVQIKNHLINITKKKKKICKFKF